VWSLSTHHQLAKSFGIVLGTGPHGVPSHLRSIRAIFKIESMEVGTYHNFTWGSSLQVPSTTWMPTCQHFLEVRLGTCVENWVERTPTLNTSPANVFALNNQDPTLITFNYTLMVSWGSKLRTLPSCRDLLTQTGLGTWNLEPIWIGPCVSGMEHNNLRVGFNDIFVEITEHHSHDIIGTYRAICLSSGHPSIVVSKCSNCRR
jgi:hypothetical protein